MSRKNARLKTNGDQSSSARIRTDATLGSLKGKLSIRIRSRGKFRVRCRVKHSFHFEICIAAMASTSRTQMRTRFELFGINFVATAGTSQILELDSLQFENHLVKMLRNKSPPQAPLGSGFSTDPPSKVQKIQKGGGRWRNFRMSYP